MLGKRKNLGYRAPDKNACLGPCVTKYLLIQVCIVIICIINLFLTQKVVFVMTFLELHKRIVQTRKARKGVKNREDYFQDDDREEFWKSVYKRALYIANEVVKHYEKKGAYDSSEKFHLSWGEDPNDYFDDYIKQMKAYEKEVKDYQNLWKEHSELFDEKLKSDNEIAQLKRELSAAKAELVRVKRGGRYKDYKKEHQVVNYKQEHPLATVREIAKALGISTTTVQKALVANGLNKRKGE